MRNPWMKGIAGVVSFSLPALMCVVGLRLDRSSIGHDPRFGVLIPVALIASLLLAAGVPAGMIASSALSLPKRIGLTLAIWCLLALECSLALYMGLMSSLR